MNNLVLDAQAGNKISEEIIIKRYRWLANYLAKKFYAPGEEVQDLEQAALIGVWQAIQIFDPSISTWSSLVNSCMRRRIWDLTRIATAQKAQILSDSITKKSDDWQDNVIDLTVPSSEEMVVFKEFVKELVFKVPLTKLEKNCLFLSIRGYSYKEISKKLNINNKTIDNAITRGKRKVKLWYEKSL